ncbi:DUF1800 family protein [Pseudoduganella sp. FT25W]|uniref:DUF1800 family protein n=1 Tax=Duganella alba TaxID=2666081 RepID=A0A6L5QLS9_9BURK|nr:DUF1800 family protein [Duganella alba]MRX17538.1 DUF1800 family protein [Duganella alba]
MGNNVKLRSSLLVTLMLSLAACGGGSSNGSATPGTISTAGISVASEPASATSPSVSALSRQSTLVRQGATQATAAVATPLTRAEAAQFLGQASFGPTMASIDALVASSKADWINNQFQLAPTLHRNHIIQVAATGVAVGQNQVLESFWNQAINGNDQLRQRVTYALSQIFVISMVDANIGNRAYGVSSYYDMLNQNAFGNFRDLLQGVALHPMMGIYLSHMRNQKESGARVPDENFAREVMQLMSIGLYQLNLDGSIKTSGGKQLETYTHDDVMGLAKVFTGWSWAGPDQSLVRFHGGSPDPARDWTPMQNYPLFHSSSSKSFLGVTTNGSGEADLKVALDTLFNHPNVGPFIGRQLIQHLVASNPSPGYISRVAAAFNNNGAGVRGDMRAVIRAVLLDPEAGFTGDGKKLREPVLRLANWMRAFNVKSTSGRFMMINTDDALLGLGQTPLRSPSVFNFYRPGYTPPNTTLAAAGMVAPEMQITGEPTVTGYLNFMQIVIPNGIGSSRDIQPDYSAEMALISQPALLVDRINQLLLAGQMSSTLRNQIITALNAVNISPTVVTNATNLETARKNRVYLAIYLTMASPEYLAQR